MRRISILFAVASIVSLALPAMALAGGGSATDLVCVADTRVLHSGIMRYFADLYNFNSMLFAIWATALTAVYGCFLGVLMDLIMSRTGIDLKHRKIIEH